MQGTSQKGVLRIKKNRLTLQGSIAHPSLGTFGAFVFFFFMLWLFIFIYLFFPPLRRYQGQRQWANGRQRSSSKGTIHEVMYKVQRWGSTLFSYILRVPPCPHHPPWTTWRTITQCLSYISLVLVWSWTPFVVEETPGISWSLCFCRMTRLTAIDEMDVFHMEKLFMFAYQPVDNWHGYQTLIELKGEAQRTNSPCCYCCFRYGSVCLLQNTSLCECK